MPSSLNDVAPYLTLVMTTKLITHEPEGDKIAYTWQFVYSLFDNVSNLLHLGKRFYMIRVLRVYSMD